MIFSKIVKLKIIERKVYEIHITQNKQSYPIKTRIHILAQSYNLKFLSKKWNIFLNIQGVTKRYGTNFRTHSSHLEDEIMLYEHGFGNALFPLK